jgi:hypothetical protein
MRIAGLPVWALVLVACAVAPFVIQLWIDAEQRRAKERTRALLRPFVTTGSDVALASGTGRAASTDELPKDRRSGDDATDATKADE